MTTMQAQEVVELGASVRQFSLGDIVYGCAGGFKGSQGAIAHYMRVDPDLMAFAPKNLSATESATLPLVGITAWLALCDRAALQANHTVLIHAASGGVGSIALQLARSLGAHTFVTASNDSKAVFARARGATVINYQNTSVHDYVQQHTQGLGFDVVFDTVGGKNLGVSIDALKESGQLCAIAASAETDLRPLHRKGATLHYVFMPSPIINQNATRERKHFGYILSQITQLAERGLIKPLVGQTITFSEITRAHELQEQHAVIGKIALKQDL